MNYRYDHLIAIDDVTGRICWGTKFQEWPRLIPDDPQISVQHYRGNSNYNPDLLRNFCLKLEEGQIAFYDPPLGADRERLLLLNAKCTVTYRWLKRLLDDNRQNGSYLPDVPLGRFNTNERSLFEQEDKRRIEMLAAEITDNHPLIWSAKTMDELTIISERIHERRYVP